MALHRYFKPAEGKCQLNPAPVRDADEAVQLRLNTKPPAKCRGEYAKFTTEQEASIASYACMHGNKAAIRHFSKELVTTIKPSSLSTWKGKYIAEMNRKVKAGEKDDTGDVSVKTLPAKRRERPLLLGD